MIDLQTEIKVLIQNALERREEELTTSIQAVQELAKTEAAQRRQLEGELGKQRAALQQLREEATAILEQLGVAP